jgi:Kef-type K+ transport system membrane component KefB
MWKLAALWLVLQAPDGTSGAASHADPGGQVVLSLAIILLAAKLGGHFAARIRQPAVLGELLAGVVLGNLSLAGFTGLDYLREDAAVDTLARIGVILLLFGVGLDSTVGQMRKVGPSLREFFQQIQHHVDLRGGHPSALCLPPFACFLSLVHLS